MLNTPHSYKINLFYMNLIFHINFRNKRVIIMSKELKIKKGSIYDVKHHIKIQRSYKSLCSMEDCYFTTHTKNHRRVGGLCLMCRSRILSSSKMTYPASFSEGNSYPAT